MKTKEKSFKEICVDLAWLNEELTKASKSAKNKKEFSNEDIEYISQITSSLNLTFHRCDEIKEEMNKYILNSFTDFKKIFDEDPVGYSNFISYIKKHPKLVVNNGLASRNVQTSNKEYDVDIVGLYDIQDAGLQDEIDEYENMLISEIGFTDYYESIIELENIAVNLTYNESHYNDYNEELEVVYINEFIYKTDFIKNFLQWFEENKDYCKLKFLQKLEV